MPLSSLTVRVNQSLPKWAVVSFVAWLSSLPWAIVHGPPAFLWVIFQALGAAVIPAVAGGWTLWRRKGDLRGALKVTLGTSAVLLACLAWTLLRT